MLVTPESETIFLNDPLQLSAAFRYLQFVFAGHYIRDICVYGLGDLQWIIESPHLFANKFEPATYPLVMDCLERRYRLKVLHQAEVPIEDHWRFQEENYFNMKLHV